MSKKCESMDNAPTIAPNIKKNDKKITFTDSDDDMDNEDKKEEQLNECTDNKIQQEINHYISFNKNSIDKDKSIAYKQNPILFWKDYSNIYPLLSQIAVQTLAPSGGSHPSESIFSKAGYILNPRRSNLSPENVDSTLFSNAIEILIVKLKERHCELLKFFD